MGAEKASPSSLIVCSRCLQTTSIDRIVLYGFQENHSPINNVLSDAARLNGNKNSALKINKNATAAKGSSTIRNNNNGENRNRELLKLLTQNTPNNVNSPAPLTTRPSSDDRISRNGTISDTDDSNGIDVYTTNNIASSVAEGVSLNDNPQTVGDEIESQCCTQNRQSKNSNIEDNNESIQIVDDDSSGSDDLQEVQPIEINNQNNDDAVGRRDSSGVCYECKRTVSNLSKHYRGNDSPILALKCDNCCFYSSSKCAMAAHNRLHNKSRPFICPDCAIVFDTLKSFYFHISEECFYLHKTVRYYCPLCNVYRGSRDIFESHLEKSHEKMLYKCNQCSVGSYSMIDRIRPK